MPSVALRSALFGLAMAALPGAALSQTPIPGTPYTRIQSTITYTELTNPTVLFDQGSSLYMDLDLPFPFRFYDQTANTVAAGNAGCVAFMPGAQVTSSNQGPGTTTSFGNIDGWIAPFWESLTMQAAQGAHLAYEVGGIAPNRFITFEWKNANRNFGTTGMEWFNFQLRLYEGLAGRIEMDYGPQGPNTAQFVTGTMGMEDLTSARPILFAASNCTNNCVLSDYTALIGQRITLVQDPGIELVALGIGVPQFATLAVDTPVTVVIANLHGTSLGPFTVEVSASPDEAGTNLTPIGQLNLSLAPYQTNEVTVTINGPISLGEASSHLVLEIDSGGSVSEVDETNNVFVSPERVRFLPSRPDFDVERVTASETMISAGTDVTVFARVTNAGSQPINNGAVGIMMSTNTAISPQDVELTRVTMSLAPGQTRTATTTVTIPAGTNSGTYWLGALADPDNAVEEVSEANNGRAALTSLAIVGGDLAILTTQLPTALLSQTYVAILTSAGGAEEVTWAVTAGMLPPGIGLVGQTGEFFGRPQTEGLYTFTVRAASGNQMDTRELTLAVSDPEEPLTIVTRALPSAVVGQEYVFEMRATGGTVTSSLAWSATGLPLGISLASDGVLTGSAIEIGTSMIEVMVSNGVEMADRQLELTVTENANLQIVPAELPTGLYGEPYSTTIMATGGVPPVNFILELGELPEGLELNTDGTISGTPVAVGKFRLVIQARDSGGGGVAAVDVNTFELTIADVPGFDIETAVLPEAIVDQGYTALVKATGGLPPYDWSLQGRLPQGMIARVDDNGDFLIVGTAAEVGVTNLLISVIDAQGRGAQRAFALVVVEVMTAPMPVDTGGCTAMRGESSAFLGILLLGIVLIWRRTRAR